MNVECKSLYTPAVLLNNPIAFTIAILFYRVNRNHSHIIINGTEPISELFLFLL